MNALDLLDAIGAAEDQDILQAQKKKRKYRWIPWAAAACSDHVAGRSLITCLSYGDPVTERR